ncbi:hypothetical protein DPX16_22635 [Anabarilius grahami]|uniref:Uncharacterized protein n=1 Tax=Anabarilius grahami TaxID=495550 RepID=A0A3N0YJH5_ANAGA|nr:hypothetical protein DPX16_22635 [Anabarilius grahami]
MTLKCVPKEEFFDPYTLHPFEALTPEDRIQNNRNNYQDQNPDSPNPSKVRSADRPVHRLTELRIDMNALIQQGIQRQQAKLFRKMEKKATQTKSCYPGTTSYQPYSQGDN